MAREVDTSGEVTKKKMKADGKVVKKEKKKSVAIPIFVTYDCDIDEMEDVTSTVANTSPCLFIFFDKKGAFETARIGGDREVVDCECNDVGLAVLIFIGTFFVFHLGYPNDYHEFLGFLQQTLLQKPFNESKGSKTTDLIVKFEDEMINIGEGAKFKKFAV